MDDATLAAIEARAERARPVGRPARGDIVWSIGPATALWESAQDVPALLAEIRELRDELERVHADFDRSDRAAGGTL